MKRQIVLLSYTPLNAGGGVPRWNRDFIAGFPNARHYSWSDVPQIGGLNTFEWSAADALGMWLHTSKTISKDDIIIADGFWGEKLSELGYNVISVAHGIWSHLTKEDVDAGKQPEFPFHHAAQVKHRRDHLARGGKIVAVSDFIADQMKLQWGFESTVINNAVDLEKFKPQMKFPRHEPIIIHGSTTANKGIDHIRLLEMNFERVWLLDDAANILDLPKYEALSQADVFVHPSAYEGNSYMVAECLASGIPIVSYDVGLMYTARNEGFGEQVGEVLDRRSRSPERTLEGTRRLFERISRKDKLLDPRGYIKNFSLERFKLEWKSFLEREYGEDV